ncbi:hypothetical protein BDQ12DRAFT_667639 [Crucibulum laeve]|uniref:Uncharacterized protein n=1 Tax=Crucibulum laeve TaxID=68775 RepID=A0A5C3LVD3_9AGAR|nr:hypothetical protein BDQ12DRAFT_667639 [Crucibulum laeve]
MKNDSNHSVINKDKTCSDPLPFPTSSMEFVNNYDDNTIPALVESDYEEDMAFTTVYKVQSKEATIPSNRKRELDKAEEKLKKEFKQDEKKKKKPQGQKQIVEMKGTKKMNWQAKKLGSTFDMLTKQAVGQWIDPEAKANGISQWKHSVLHKVPTGHALEVNQLGQESW